MEVKVFTKQKTGSLGDLYGIFFEDLNHAADGGLYAEMVQNRGFEYCAVDHPQYHSLMAWEKIEKKYSRMQWSVQDTHPFSRKNPHYLVFDVFEVGKGAGIRNTGYKPGMYFKAQETYLFSCLAAGDGRKAITMRLVLEDEEGNALAQDYFTIDGGTNWNTYKLELTVEKECRQGSLCLYQEEVGRIYLDMVSLFPKHTFRNRENGLRADLAQMLADLKPRFLRFPGGCLVHDGSLRAEDRDSLYRWKNTIGKVEERPSKRNNWGYNQTLGLGYYEYFCLCEDIGAKPLPVVPAGYDPHHQRMVPFEKLGEWVQETLDLIEFANGDVLTKWGKVRSELGHPKPFGLEYIGVGNEEVGEGFFERYPYFHRAIREKYPEIKIIASSGPFAAGGEYEKGWNCARSCHSDLVDEHYYMAPEWFIANHHRYDDFPEGPKVFLGEYASWGNTWYNALVEASYMIGFERNAHHVGLTCYAPLFCNVNYVNWKPDMIWFDNSRVYGSANYYVQKLFMNHQGDDRLKMEVSESGDVTRIADEAIGGFGLRSQPETVAVYTDIQVEEMDSPVIWKPSMEELRDAGAELTKEGAVIMRGDSKDVILRQIKSSHYKITMNATKISGKRGFMLQYGVQDAQNRYNWEIGGWQNMDGALTQDIHGRGSCLTQSEVIVKTDHEYQLCLEVEGRHITAYLDGEKIHEIENSPVVIEPIYYAASKEQVSGDVIVKLVNLQEEEKKVAIKLADLDVTQGIEGVAYVMAGYALDAENSFEEPQKVSPVQKQLTIENGICDYTVQGCSVNILRFQNIVL